MDKEFILQKPQGRANSRYIKKNYPNEYGEIIKHEGSSFSEQLYNYFYNNPPHICPTCGKKTPFRSILRGYFEYCSIECSYTGTSRIEKTKQTCLERYGVTNPSQSKEIQDKKRETCLKNYGVSCGILTPKTKQTCLERYGVTNPSQSKEIQDKKRETCLKNYGFEWGFQSDKTQSTILEKYGVKHISQSKEIQDKKRETWRSNFLTKHNIHIGYNDEGDWICKCPHPACDKCKEKIFTIPQQTFNDRMRNQSEICTKLLPIGIFIQKTSLEIFVRNILDKYNIQYLTNVRNIITPKELDIYIPSKNIAIECNGIYWHSLKNPTYHKDKFIECEKNGVQLLTVWEDWIKNKPNIVESLILSKLNIYDTKIGARECLIKDISANDCKKFLNKYHIQGYSSSSIKLGLWYKDELVSVMTFSKSRIGIGSNEIGYELVRFCNKKGLQVIGGASKLLNYFINNYNPEKIISYSSNDISNGDLYKKLCFVKEKESFPSYWYIQQNTFDRYHRFNFRKHRLKEMGYDVEIFTENEIMKNLPYWRIYDSGNKRWVLYVK